MVSPRRFRSFGLAALVVLLSSLPVLSPAPAAAQDYGFFGNLFGGGLRPPPGAPAYPGYGGGSSYPPRSSDNFYVRPSRRLPRHKMVEPAQREASPKDKAPPKNASVFVDVFGDSLGLALANGLDDALADRSDIAVVHKARASTGLIVSNGFDWPKAIEELLAGHDPVEPQGEKAAQPPDPAQEPSGSAKPAKAKIDVAVMMVGSNDRQPISVDGKTLQPGTPDWNGAYAKRVLAINEAFRAKKIPLVWVGVPITKDDGFADAMAALNDIYREAAAKAGSIYVDTWEAFSDEDGDFSAYGPDINGQTVRLRSADGINFTKAGARKLAHFVETHVRRALEGKTPAPQLPTVEAPQAPGKTAKPTVAARPDIGPIRNLNDPPSAANGSLAAFDAKQPRSGDASGAGGAGPPGPVGRADNSRWSGKSSDEP